MEHDNIYSNAARLSWPSQGTLKKTETLQQIISDYGEYLILQQKREHSTVYQVPEYAGNYT